MAEDTDHIDRKIAERIANLKGDDDSLGRALLIVWKSFKSNITPIVATCTLMIGTWKAVGEDKLNEKIDSRIEEKIKPVIMVVDTTFILASGNKYTWEEYLKDLGKEDVLDRSKRRIDSLKAVLEVKKKLGKDKYKKGEK